MNTNELTLSNETKLDGNKELATFMNVDWEDVFAFDSEGCTIPLIYTLNYDESWDLLMPVWRRFLKEIHFNLSNKKIREDYKMHKALISDGIYACCKETTYRQLIKAIQWANETEFEELLS